MTELLINGPISAEYTVVLAHGAGAPMGFSLYGEDGSRVGRYRTSRGSV